MWVFRSAGALATAAALAACASTAALAQPADRPAGGPRGGPRGEVGGPPGSPGRPWPGGPTEAPGRASDKVHALTGMWTVKETWKRGPVASAGDIPFKPEYEAERDRLYNLERNGGVLTGRNLRCIPGGPIDQFTFGFRVMANAEFIMTLGGSGPTFRTIWLNKAEHTPSELLFPSINGESIAHWEGDTLVIDTVGLDPTNEFFYGFAPLDDNVRMVERWTLRKPDEIQIDVTVYSEKTLTKPWTFQVVMGRRDLDEPINYCTSPITEESAVGVPPAGGFIPEGADR